MVLIKGAKGKRTMPGEPGQRQVMGTGRLMWKVPRDHGLDFELGEKLKNVEPSPLRKGGKSTILIKEQMENGWVHRFLYVAPTEKAMLNRLVALGFKNPGEQFTTWVKMAEGTKVIHV